MPVSINFFVRIRGENILKYDRVVLGTTKSCVYMCVRICVCECV